MSESYTVAARLNMTSNVSEVLSQITRAFRDVNDLLKSTQSSLGRFSADLRSLQSGSRGIGGLVAGLEKLNTAKLGGGILADMEKLSSFSAQLAESQALMARSSRETAAAWREIAAASKGPGGRGPGGSGPAPGGSAGRPGGGISHVGLANTAIGLQATGDAGAGFLERSIMAAFDVEHLLTQFRMNNSVGDKEIAALRAKAESLVRSVPGTTIAENLHTMLDAFTVTGNLAEAMAGSETMSKLNMVLKSLPGAHQGDPAFAAAQSVELMQRFYDPKTHEVSLDQMNKQVAAMAVVAAGTGGRADPTKYLAFAKQARLGGMMADDSFLYRDLPALLIALNGSRAGTGEAATFQQFLTGTMTKNAADELKKAGLLDKNAVWKGGRVQDMGHKFHGLGEYTKNPVEWVREYILDPKNGVLAKNHIDPNDKAAVGKFLAAWSARQTGLGWMAELVLGMTGIDKESGKIGNTTSDPMKTIAQFDPMLKLKEFQAAENELMVTLGSALMGPALDSLRALTTALREMSDWAKKNPTAAKDIALVGAGLTVLAKGAGDAAMALLIGGPLLGGLGGLARGLGSFAAGTEAASGLALLSGPLGLAALAAAIIATAGSFTNSGPGGGGGRMGPHAPRPNWVPPPGSAPPPGDPHAGMVWDRRRGWRTPSGAATPDGTPVHPSAYHPDADRPIILMLDGRVLGKSVTRHQENALRLPSNGHDDFDPRQGLMTPATLVRT